MSGREVRTSRLLTAALLVTVLVIGGLYGAVTTGLLTHSSAVAPADNEFVLGAATGSTINISKSPTALPPEFWGANVRGYAPLGSPEAKDWQATPLRTAIWPGAYTGDGFDLIANRIYQDSSAWVKPGSSVTDFVSWCRSVGCIAVLQLSGEINDAAYAAKEVSYVVNTLHFQPAYFQVGNEPTRWTHFGVPWSQWRASQHTNATPMEYAQMLQRYIVAIRAVDPAAQFIGLPGVGTGAYGETTWIKATVGVNGHDLAAVAIHVYPAGGHVGGTGTLSAFMQSLAGHGGIPARAPADEAAIRAACSSCSIALFVTEMGSGTMGYSFDKYMSGFPQVVYLAAEIVQGMNDHVASLMPYSFVGTYPGSLFYTPTSPTHIDTLYTTIFAQLGSQVLATTILGGSSLVYSTASYDPRSHNETLIVVNADPSQSLALSLKGTDFVGRTVTESLWTSSSTKPVVSTHTGGLGSVSVGPVGLVLLKIAGVTIVGNPGNAPSPTGMGSAAGPLTSLVAAPASVSSPTLRELNARVPAADGRAVPTFAFGGLCAPGGLRGP